MTPGAGRRLHEQQRAAQRDDPGLSHAPADRRTRSDREIVNAVREQFAGQFPAATYRFVSGGIVSRTINFGSETTLEVEVLAIAVIGGLLVSTVFTLVLIPTLYVIFEERFPRTLVDEVSQEAQSASD